jgi:hypothetical protein
VTASHSSQPTITAITSFCPSPRGGQSFDLRASLFPVRDERNHIRCNASKRDDHIAIDNHADFGLRAR